MEESLLQRGFELRRGVWGREWHDSTIYVQLQGALARISWVGLDGETLEASNAEASFVIDELDRLMMAADYLDQHGAVPPHGRTFNAYQKTPPPEIRCKAMIPVPDQASRANPEREQCRYKLVPGTSYCTRHQKLSQMGAISEEQVALIQDSLNPERKARDPYTERTELLAAGGWICKSCGGPNPKGAKECKCGRKKTAKVPPHIDPAAAEREREQGREAPEREAREWRERGGHGVTPECHMVRHQACSNPVDCQCRCHGGEKKMGFEGLGAVSSSCDLGAHERCVGCGCGCHGGEAFIECRVCDREFTEEEWDGLPSLGEQQSEEEGVRFFTEMKNCPCGGTMATEEQIDLEDIEIGTEHELEHTTDRRIAEQIALDHLREDPDYYEKLAKAGL